MSIKIKLVSGTTYTAPDGRQFLKGVVYDAQDSDAMNLLAKRTERGGPYFGRVKDSELEPAPVVEEKAEEEVEVRTTTVPSAKSEEPAKDADKNGDTSQFTITHGKSAEAVNAEGAAEAGDPAEQGASEAGETGDPAGETTGAPVVQPTASAGDAANPAETGKAPEAESTKAPAKTGGKGGKGGVTIVRKDKDGLVDTAEAGAKKEENTGGKDESSAGAVDV